MAAATLAAGLLAGAVGFGFSPAGAMAASAGTPDAGVLRQLPPLPILPPLLGGILGGDRQVLDGASDLLCDPVTRINKILGSVTCAIGALDFRFQTRLRTPAGEIVRTQLALVNVPTLLNVDADILPDIVATVTATSLTRFGLRIDRFLGETSTLPLSVEALIDDPTHGTLPREHIAFGYDARETRAPVSWTASITLADGEREDDVVKLDVVHRTVAAGAALTITAGLYDGEPTERTNPLGGRLTYSPVAPSASFGLTLGERVQLRLGACVPVGLTADAELVDGPEEQHFHAALDALPSSVVLDYDRSGPNQRLVEYRASAAVGRLDVDYRDLAEGALLQRAVVTALRLPLGMRIEQRAKVAGTFSTTGGALGSVEVGFANGDPRLLAGATTHYAYIVEDGDLISYAGRVDELLSASFDGTDAVVLDAEFAARNAFVVKLQLPGVNIDGRLEDLPNKVHVGIDVANGSIEYDGFGQTIDRIAVEGTRTTPWFLRATHVAAEVRSLPAKVVIGFKPKLEEVTFTASQPIGKIEVSATDGALEYPVGAEAGAVLRDVPDRFVAAGRILGLRSVRLASSKADTHLTTQMAAGPFTVVAETPTDRLDGRIADLPGGIDLQIVDTPQSTNVVYTADASIARIEAHAKRKVGVYAGRITRIDAELSGLPKQATVKVTKESGAIAFSTDQTIAVADVRLSSGPEPVVLPAGESGAVVHDLADRFTAAARVRGVRAVSFSDVGGEMTVTAKIARQPLHAIYKRADLDVDARLSDVPDDVTVKINAAAGTASYAASAPISTLDATVTSQSDLFGRVKRIAAHLEGIPAQLALVFKPQGGSGGDFDAPQGIDLAEIELTDGDAATRLPNGRSGIKLRDVPNDYSLFVRVRKLLGGSVLSSGSSVNANVRTGEISPGVRQSFELDADVDVANDAVHAVGNINASLDRLPGDVRINHTDIGTRYTASERIPVVRLRASNLPGDTVKGKIHHIEAMVRGVPRHFFLRHDTFTTGIEAFDGEAIDRIDAELWDEAPRLEGLAEDGRNKVLVDSRGGSLKARVRVFGLKKATLTSFPTSQDIETVFSAPPAPLDAVLRGGTAVLPTNVDVVATELARSSRLKISSVGGTTVAWNAESVGTDLAVNVVSPDVSISNMRVVDLPTFMRVCVGGRYMCGQRASEFVVVDGDELYTLPNGFNLDSDANGDIRIARGKVCLPITDDRGRRLGFPADAAYRPCAPDDKHFIDLTDLVMRKVHLEVGGGETVEQDDDGDAEEDGLIKLYVDTDDFGIRVNPAKIVNTSTGSTTEIRTNEMALRNQRSGRHFYAVIDTDPPPSIEDKGNRSGRLICEEGDYEVEIIARLFGIDVDVLDLPDFLFLCT